MIRNLNNTLYFNKIIDAEDFIEKMCDNFSDYHCKTKDSFVFYINVNISNANIEDEDAGEYKVHISQDENEMTYYTLEKIKECTRYRDS